MAKSSVARREREEAYGVLGVPKRLLDAYILHAYGTGIEPTPSARAEIEGDFLKKVREMLGGFYARGAQKAFPGEVCQFFISRGGVLTSEAQSAIKKRFMFDGEATTELLSFLMRSAERQDLNGDDWALVHHGHHLYVNPQE